MSKISGYYQPYICSVNECALKDKVQKHFVWSNEVETKVHKCTSCKSELSINDIPEEPDQVDVPALIGLHFDRNIKERKKRNHKHFLNEVLPTQDADTKRHHLNKMGKKL
jgi:hypothetical protein